MRGDKLLIEPHHRRAAAQLATLLEPRATSGAGPLIISIGGESGSGKSELAAALVEAFRRRGVPCILLQQDDYFVYPPKTNDRKRREEIAWVGPQEVRLDRLDETLRELRSGAEAIRKPLVFYEENRIGEETVHAEGIRAAIVEGTYTTLLSNVDVRIFIDRTFQQTRDARMGRGREAQDEFLERVLQIEHKIIAAHKTRADVLVTSDYSVQELEPQTR